LEYHRACLASCHTLKIQTKTLIYNKIKTKTSNRIEAIWWKTPDTELAETKRLPQEITFETASYSYLVKHSLILSISRCLFSIPKVLEFIENIWPRLSINMGVGALVIR